MIQKELKSWTEFEEQVAPLAEKMPDHQTLFRGQSKSEWSLDTTLERFGAIDYPEQEYFRNIVSVRRKLETVTGKKWELSEEYKEPNHYLSSPQGYEFMVFLRHHGFPSPLLDWTRSPYVASFFAFRHANPKTNDFVTIFEYVEDVGEGKVSSRDEATISVCGPWISTDKKHFLQQSEYTVCRKEVRRPNGGYGADYVKHEKAFERDDKDQDILTKYLIPTKERERVLRKLQFMNITSFSLFESTESLLELVASEVIKL